MANAPGNGPNNLVRDLQKAKDDLIAGLAKGDARAIETLRVRYDMLQSRWHAQAQARIEQVRATAAAPDCSRHSERADLSVSPAAGRIGRGGLPLRRWITRGIRLDGRVARAALARPPGSRSRYFRRSPAAHGPVSLSPICRRTFRTTNCWAASVPNPGDLTWCSSTPAKILPARSIFSPTMRSAVSARASDCLSFSPRPPSCWSITETRRTCSGAEPSAR